VADREAETTSLALVEPTGAPETAPSPLRVLGIDLGTTNSTVAEVLWSRGEAAPLVARCLEVEQPTDTGPYTHVLVPSVVALHGGQVFVGEGAKRLRARAELRRNRDIFYECKNDMGVRRTYHLAPEGFRSAAEIGAKVLAFLKAAAHPAGSLPAARTVVTVPASFQLAQRRDTLKAAQLAGLDLKPGDLLDEPVAAFLDYLVTRRDALPVGRGGPRNLLVFDFGGGTCDVAVFRVGWGEASGQIEVCPLAVSRYYRLGGGDLDAAIVHEVLLPQLAEQNGLDLDAFDFDQRKRYLEPALLSVAEALKVGLCMEIARLRSFGRYANSDKTSIAKTHPGRWPCPCPGHPELSLQTPRLSAAQFEQLLEPFLDTELLYARETEYRLTCSIFAPIQDALDRAALRPADVDLCLLVGGSSLIPQVRDAVRAFFPAADLLAYEDRDSTQVAVARGAAYHALFLALFGRSLVRPVAHDAVSLRVASGLLELVPKGAALPFPGPDRFVEHFELAVPQSVVVGSVPLRVELVAGTDARPVFGAKWEIPGPVNRGEPLRLGVHMDANQTLHLALTLRNRPDAEPFACTIENPLTHVVNPGATRQRIEEVEEELRTGKIAAESLPDTLHELANDYATLGQSDKAIHYLKQAIRLRNRPDASLLHSLGVRYGEKGDWKREEKAYREAFSAAPQWPAPLFNLALSQFHRGRLEEAEATIREALAVRQDPPYQVLHALILKRCGRAAEAQDRLSEALKAFRPVAMLDDWELGWFRTAAREGGDSARLEEATAEQQGRQRTGRAPKTEPGGVLPEIAPSLRKP